MQTLFLSRAVIQPYGLLGLINALEDLPCIGSHYCRRVHERWQEFSSEVEYVIHLAPLFF